MRMGFTGTRSVHPSLMQHVFDHVHDETGSFIEFTTGACSGFDALAAHWLLDHRPEAIHRLVVPAQLAQVDHGIVERFRDLSSPRHIIEHMPAGTSYRDRNERILDHSDELVAVAEAPEFDGRSRRSGTWMTIRIARRRGIRVHEMILSEAM